MAVRTVRGKHRSERTGAEELQILEQELENLSGEEQEALAVMLDEIRQGRVVHPVGPVRAANGEVITDVGRPLFELVQEADYCKPIVPVEEWLRDSYFMGRTEFQWPVWRRDLADLFSGGYHEAILTGAIGTGKSTFCEMAFARMIYEFSCLRDPQRAFGLMPGSHIYIVVMNISVELAQKTVFEGLKTLIGMSDYFRREFPMDDTQKVIRFPNKLFIVPRASQDTSTLGLNVIAGILSETNFTEGGHESRSSANAAVASHARHGTSTEIGHVYAELVTRRKSRFGRVGRLPGLYIIDSSKRDASDFTEQHIVEVRDDPFVFVRDYAIWDTQPAQNFSKTTFRVFVGDEKVSPRILGADEHVVPAPGTTQQIIDVPDNWRREFETNLDAAIRNVAGIATQAIDRLFPTMTAVREAMDRGREHGNPFSAETWVADRPIEVQWDQIAENRAGVWTLRHLPRAEHAVHMDIGVRRDRFGVACAFVAGETNVPRNVAGQITVEKAPIIVVRWALAFEAPRDGEIELGIGRALVWSAMAHGHRIRWGSCDQYQSVETLQKMRAKGIDAEQLSVDVDDEAYLMLRTAVAEGRLILPDNGLLYTELRYLIWDKVRCKVDHPPKRTKDVADAVAGAVHRLTLLFLEGEAKPAAAMPVLGLTEMYEDEEVEEQFWVLGPGAARPQDPREKAGHSVGGGAGTVRDETRKRRPFIVK